MHHVQQGAGRLGLQAANQALQQLNVLADPLLHGRPAGRAIRFGQAVPARGDGLARDGGQAIEYGFCLGGKDPRLIIAQARAPTAYCCSMSRGAPA